MDASESSSRPVTISYIAETAGVSAGTRARVEALIDEYGYQKSGPPSRSSGSSIKGEHPARTGNRKLKRAFFLAAFAALSDPTSRAYHQRKRDQGKKHNAALICLARRRCDVLFAMLRTKTHYRRPETAPAPVAA